MTSKRTPDTKPLSAAEIGQIGGRARVKNMSKKQLSESAAHAANMRWKKTKKV